MLDVSNDACRKKVSIVIVYRINRLFIANGRLLLSQSLLIIAVAYTADNLLRFQQEPHFGAFAGTLTILQQHCTTLVRDK